MSELYSNNIILHNLVNFRFYLLAIAILVKYCILWNISTWSYLGRVKMSFQLKYSKIKCPTNQAIFSKLIKHMEKLLWLFQVQFSTVQWLSCVWLIATPWTATHQASLSITNTWSLLKLFSIKSVMSWNNLILCHPFLLLFSVFNNIRVFSKESVLHIRWLKYWSFRFNVSPSSGYSGLISSRMDWLDLSAVQVALKSPLHTTVQKHHFFVPQLSL